MNIGEPQRIHEIEPLKEPVPNEEPAPEHEPEKVPVGPGKEDEEWK